jgi:hypothetical protein
MLPDRKAFEIKLGVQLAQLDSEIGRIQAKVQHAGADALVRIHRVLDTLQRRHDAAAHHLRALEAASDEAWGGVKTGSDQAWLEIRALFKRPAPGRP